MNASLNVPPPTGVRPGRGPLGGIMLIVIGLIALLWQFMPNDTIALWFMPLLGIVFLTWGLLSREVGLLVPGGILIGIGAGVLLMREWQMPDNSMGTSAIFMLTFAAGWALITLASWFIHKTVWWPLIVGAILALVGVGLLFGKPALPYLEMAGKLWPLILVALGVWVLFKRSGWKRS
ncbi:MAG: hypothetical protein HZB53_15775 [Chloroflexi bacterium]|nr:hypothetical protein [Chloroflexota bacterium]